MEDAKKKRLGTGRVAFLARKDEIKAKIDAGHTMVTVYEAHQKELGISYGQFVNYVNKFIRRKPDGNEGKKAEAPAHSPSIEIGTKESVARKAVPSERKFVRKENRDDLINPKE